MRAVRVDGYVLTGGLSSRFGSDKALHVVGGQAMALQVAHALGELASRVTLVGDPARHGALGLRVIPDVIPGAGPLGGIVAALADAERQWILIVACDLPNVSAAPLETLLRFASDSDVRAVVPRTPDGRLQPLCAAYAKEAQGPLEAALRNGTRKVTDALRDLHWRAVDMEDAGPFTNVNRPSDLESLRRTRT